MDITDDDYLQLLLPDGNTKEDVQLPKTELGQQIAATFHAIAEDDTKELMVTIVAAMGSEAPVSYKEAVRISLYPRSIYSRLYLCSPTNPRCHLLSSPGRSSIVPSDPFVLPGSLYIWL